jgi:AcrR family transcriptional regulator
MADDKVRELDRAAEPAVRRRRAAHLGPERRRPLVLDAAFRLFLEHGYEGTSMAAIAAAAGVTKPVVYDCYPSKEELFEALLRREESRVLGEIQASLPADADVEDPEPLLVEALTAFLRAVAESPDAYRIIFLGEGASTAVARRIQHGRAAQVEAVAALVRGWLEGREASIDIDIDAGARLLGVVIVGLAESGARAMLSDPDTWSPDLLGRLLGRMAAQGRGIF